MEHKELWATTGPVDAQPAALGKARVVRAGDAATLVSWSGALHAAAAACDELAREGIAVELIDLRTIWPWDRDAVLGSAARTKRLVIAHEAIQVAGFGAEIAATAAEEIGVRVKRVGGARIPVGYAPSLEAEARIDAARIAAAVRAVLR
jgi:acetoin:2,6-dichlorophenolindophenol oxidoreductase subunit beta